jgi:UDP-N-acetylmuramoyl-tripeptide--D-alanyl-D-alanine ligase
MPHLRAFQNVNNSVRTMILSEIAALFECALSQELSLSGISIDSRQIKPGHLFIAIRGERFDGHDYISQAVTNGAVAVICEKTTEGLTVPQILVPDTLHALASIATLHRQKLTCPIIALTGSNGKTTVKEMIAAILPQPSFATPGNLNNHIGVPLSVLQLNPTHRYAVFELGANHPQEIAHTVAIVQPCVTLINNIAPAHIEGFGSIDGVASAKGEIHQGLAADGVAVINDDDTYAHYWDAILVDKKILRFSAANQTAIHARDILFNANGCARFTLVTPQGTSAVELQIPGLHSVRNALAAAACTHALNLSLAHIVSGLQRFSGVAGRMMFKPGKHAAVIIDDTYNANLRSVLTALDVLAQRPGKRIFVFGDMGELGSWSQQHHHEVGVAAREHGIDLLMTCGRHSQSTANAFGKCSKHYTNQSELTRDLLEHLDEQTTVLVKGSRSASMEKIVHELVE